MNDQNISDFDSGGGYQQAPTDETQVGRSHQRKTHNGGEGSAIPQSHFFYLVPRQADPNLAPYAQGQS